mmetsp:Transcript_15849/g.31032  ORF Transcript_15849/g.31032 Transcript_15849/m.31032 type:complete len:427 (+) Transcript_15849:27-1307(+)|eukprot:CAMPEP_0175120522 /NCGR_PEP_ID=MMETSP0087-20121206/669_1 /TAXON_ID=136419 /ORGANISM="Unknown Unknown, Strain D1" /LENGTH=426 /DNA_ID=CAMNT_0016401981 /DNA_START=26 /DNA_END=1306 /DNA_ORIENTATION=-
MKKVSLFRCFSRGFSSAVSDIGDVSRFHRGRDSPEYSRLLTKAVQSGEAGGRVNLLDCLTTPIAQTATHTFSNSQHVIDHAKLGQYEGVFTNPTISVLEDKLACMENGEDCLFSASGMNACTTMLMALLPRGGHLITTKDCYRRTRQFVAEFLHRMDITFTVVDLDDTPVEQIKKLIRDEKPQLFFSESPTNPYLRCIDIRAISSACKEVGTLLCVDSTFATPINQRPLELGADLVLHSATKYLAGHNDVLCGALVGKRLHIEPVRQLHNMLGGFIDPHAAYLALRGMKTLGVRVKQQNDTALAIAQFMVAQPQIERVWYPGLPTHPDYHIARKQMQGYGGVLSFVVKGGLHAASRFIDSVKIPYIAPSLGGVESLIEQPTIISYWDKTPQERAAVGILDGLVRFSCGVEHADDLMADFQQALSRV